jgi:hypothetical protein
MCYSFLLQEVVNYWQVLSNKNKGVKSDELRDLVDFVVSHGGYLLFYSQEKGAERGFVVCRRGVF